MKIFISYSTRDKEVALTINYDLKNLGIETLFDEERIKENDDIDKYMKSIKSCDYVISLVSINYIQSYYCMSEIAEIKEELEKKLIPIVLNSSHELLERDPKLLNNYIDYWSNKYKSISKYKKNTSGEFDTKVYPVLSQNTTIGREINNYLTIMNIIPKFIYRIQSTRCLDFSSLKKTNYNALLKHIGYKSKLQSKIENKKFKILKKNNLPILGFTLFIVIIITILFFTFKNLNSGEHYNNSDTINIEDSKSNTEK